MTLQLAAGILITVESPIMENPKIAFKRIFSDEVTSIDKIKCSKCGGAGNFKTHENSRRTCLVCFGRGFINI